MEFDGFPREKDISLKYITMTQYDATFENVQIAYARGGNTFGEYIAGAFVLRIVETEKYCPCNLLLHEARCPMRRGTGPHTVPKVPMT